MKLDKAILSFSTITIIACYLWLSSCRHESFLPAGTPEICYDSVIFPLFRSSCSYTGCHDGVSLESNWTFNSYADIMAGIIPFKPDKSQFYLRMTGKGEGLMPPGRPLSIESRSLVRIWILQGADSTKCNTVPPVKK